MFPVQHLIKRQSSRPTLNVAEIQTQLRMKNDSMMKSKQSVNVLPRLSVIPDVEVNNPNNRDIQSSSISSVALPLHDISSVSDVSESPYKRLSEKEVFFKILDKHQDALADKKKR